MEEILDPKRFKPLLAREWIDQPSEGWFLSEKLDGVRAIWTGRRLISRNGNEFLAPQWFLESLPSGVALDGELYCGRGQFQKAVSIVRKKTPQDAEWRGVRFVVFDAPLHSGTFAERLAMLRQLQQIDLLDQIVCRGEDHLIEQLDSITACGGEGVMLRDPSSIYQQGRSSSLLKVKKFDSDEAELIGSEQGEGKFSGMIGALVLRWNQVIFRVGTGLNESQRHACPPIGSMVSFGYCGLTDSGVPRFPTFLGVRDYE